MTKQLTQSLREWMDVFMHRSMRGWSQFAKSTGLSMPQFSILMQLHYKGSCNLSEVSERFDVTAAAASQLVDKLVQSNYVQRAEDQNDRRAKVLQISAKGTRLVNEGIQERYQWMEELAKSLSADEKSKVHEALSILTEAARKLESDS
jgi:DNA-binding MarR family transcriptional regulator